MSFLFDLVVLPVIDFGVSDTIWKCTTVHCFTNAIEKVFLTSAGDNGDGLIQGGIVW